MVVLETTFYRDSFYIIVVHSIIKPNVHYTLAQETNLYHENLKSNPSLPGQF